MKQCGAKTRAGAPCKTTAMRNGRCRMHGGKSLAWFAHPNYKHGRYSKYGFEGIKWQAELKRRRQLRARIRAIKAMGQTELLAEKRRIFGRRGLKDWNLEEVRAWLLMACEAQLERDGVRSAA